MNPTLLSLYDRFCAYAMDTRAASTALLYKSTLRRFFIHLNKISAQKMLAAHFISYPGWLMRQPLSKGSMKIHLAVAKSFLEWLLISDLIDISYSEKAKIDLAFRAVHKRRESKLAMTISAEDVDKVRKQAYLSPLPSPIRERDIALVELMYSSGCRISEALSIDAKKLDLESRKALIIGKGSKERWIHFSYVAAQKIKEYWLARDYEGGPVFARHDDGSRKGEHKIPLSAFGARLAIKNIARDAGVENFHPHLFRHNFGTVTLNKTRDLALTQDLMGHSSPTSTRIYAKVDEARMSDEHKEVWG